MYPFGFEVGDSSGPFSDCNNGFTTIPLTVASGFPFLGQMRYNVYVSNSVMKLLLVSIAILIPETLCTIQLDIFCIVTSTGAPFCVEIHIR